MTRAQFSLRVLRVLRGEFLYAPQSKIQNPKSKIALALAAAVSFSSASLAQPLKFETQTVLADFMWNSPTSTAVDSQGNVHTAYMSQVGTASDTKEIWYARRHAQSAQWAFTRITDNTVREEFPCLALDQHDNVHIAFHTGVTGGTNKVRYVNNVGQPAPQPGQPSTFNPIIDITPNGYSITRVAIGPDDVAHFIFRSHISGSAFQEMHYTTYTPAVGVGPILNLSNSPSQDDYGGQIVIDANNKIHVVWQRGSPISGPLEYLTTANPSGQFATVPTGVPGNIFDPKILISPQGVISIFYRPSNDALRYIESPGVGQPFAPSQPVYTDLYRAGNIERMAVDSDGYRYLTFGSNIAANHGTFFVRETKEGWQTPQLLVDGSNLGASTAICPSGKVVVTYQLSGINAGQVYADIFIATASLQNQPPCPADINGCGTVDVDDLLVLLQSWGACREPGGCPADLAPAGPPAGDGSVDVDDLLVLLQSWGACP